MLKYTEKRVNYKILAISLLFFSCTSNLAILSLASTKDVNMNLKHKNIGSVSVDQTFVHLYLFGIITTNVNGVGWKEIEVQYDPLTGEKIN